MRRQSRELALQMLFQLEFIPTVEARAFLHMLEVPADGATIEYAQAIHKGVLDHKDEIDGRISGASRHWKIDRMASVDVNIMRVALFEMLFANEPVKSNIAINEAVEIAKVYGTTESASFINGILDSIARTQA